MILTTKEEKMMRNGAFPRPTVAEIRARHPRVRELWDDSAAMISRWADDLYLPNRLADARFDCAQMFRRIGKTRAEGEE